MLLNEASRKFIVITIVWAQLAKNIHMVVVTTLESFFVTIKVRTKHILAETSQGRIEGGGDTERFEQ